MTRNQRITDSTESIIKEPVIAGLLYILVFLTGAIHAIK